METFSARWVSTHFIPPSCIFSPGVARLALARTLGGMHSPSDCVKSPATIQETLDSPSGLRCGRPSDRYGPPTALFDRELANLRSDLEHLEEIMPDIPTVENAFKFVLFSTGFYADEKERGSHLRGFLEDLLPGESKWQQPVAGGTAQPDGIWFEGPFTYLILIIKNERGFGGNPSLQCLNVYGKIINHKEVPSSPLPVALPLTRLK